MELNRNNSFSNINPEEHVSEDNKISKQGSVRLNSDLNDQVDISKDRTIDKKKFQTINTSS